MQEPKIIQHPSIKQLPPLKIGLRKDFYSRFATVIKEIFSETNSVLFSHTIVENYKRPGHDYKVSTFSSNEEWHELYWNKFWHEDNAALACHEATLKNGLGVTSWQLIDPTSECMEARTTVGNVTDGVLIAFKHSEGVIENMGFGWKNFDTQNLSPEKIAFLNKIISPIRQYHLQTVHSYI